MRSCVRGIIGIKRCDHYYSSCCDVHMPRIELHVCFAHGPGKLEAGIAHLQLVRCSKRSKAVGVSFSGADLVTKPLRPGLSLLLHFWGLDHSSCKAKVWMLFLSRALDRKCVPWAFWDSTKAVGGSPEPGTRRASRTPTPGAQEAPRTQVESKLRIQDTWLPGYHILRCLFNCSHENNSGCHVVDPFWLPNAGFLFFSGVCCFCLWVWGGDNRASRVCSVLICVCVCDCVCVCVCFLGGWDGGGPQWFLYHVVDLLFSCQLGSMVVSQEGGPNRGWCLKGYQQEANPPSLFRGNFK